jgi:hypothetical protein
MKKLIYTLKLLQLNNYGFSMYCAIQTVDGTYNLEQVLSPDQCTGILMSEGADLSYWIRALVDPSFFSTADYQTVFMFGFALPVTGYLVAWGYQTVINFATKESQHG